MEVVYGREIIYFGNLAFLEFLPVKRGNLRPAASPSHGSVNIMERVSWDGVIDFDAV